MTSSRSKIWDYFEKVGDGGTCKIPSCTNASVKGKNTSNLWFHLEVSFYKIIDVPF